MITATEMRARSAASKVHIEKFLSVLEPMMLAAADKGLRSLEITDADWFDTMETYENPVPTVKQQALMKELNALGYRTNFGRMGIPYVPRSREDDDNPREITNCGITVSW